MRRLPPILPTLSLACCLVLCGLWVRSYWRDDYVGGSPTDGPGAVIESERGLVTVTASTRFDGPGGWVWAAYPVTAGRQHTWPGVWRDGRSAVVWFPLWVLISLCATPAAIHFMRRKRSRGTGFPVSPTFSASPEYPARQR